jgi:hypothetical protein
MDSAQTKEDLVVTPGGASLLANGLSKIACHNCRRRKVRCDRRLPGCSICGQNGQPCTYPEKMLKPGPKLGSKNNRYKRRRLSADGDQSDQDDDNTLTEEQTDCTSSENGKGAHGRLSISSPSALKDAKEIQSLSFIIHPSHETTSPNQEAVTSAEPSPNSNDSLIIASCATMGIVPRLLPELAEEFFRTFTSFKLFTQSRFWAHVNQIQDQTQMDAFLAAVVAFAVKQRELNHGEQDMTVNGTPTSSSQIMGLAISAANKAVAECGDEPPSLHLLQALVLISHWLLIQGVRGRAWRFLGVCIRVAYEMNLHLIDSGKPPEYIEKDQILWAQDEDKRRAWWAIWEMDVFASVIRRCPTAISWTQNETFLPAEDDRWEQQQPQQSCVLEPITINRCKALQRTGNQSPRSWFIVINSIMKDAQNISSPTGINKFTDAEGSSTKPSRSAKQMEALDESRKRLTTFYNAARYFTMALPASLKYRGQYLSFSTASASGSAGMLSLREAHACIYSIHLMTQLCLLMALKYNLFRVPPKAHTNHETATTGHRSDPKNGCLTGKAQEDIEQYFEASNSILDITHRCHDQFYRYVNPFLVNTIWLAAAVQLLRRDLFSSTDTEKELVGSNFEVLRMTYDQFIEFWRTIGTAKKNLDALEVHLKTLQDNADDDAAQTAARRPPSHGFQRPPSQSRTIDNAMQAVEDGLRQNASGKQSPCLRETRYRSANERLVETSHHEASTLNASQYEAAANAGSGDGTTSFDTAQSWPLNQGAVLHANSNDTTYNNGFPADQTGTVPQAAFDNNQTYPMDDQYLFDPFNLSDTFDFDAGTGVYSTFDDVFSGSIF